MTNLKTIIIVGILGFILLLILVTTILVRPNNPTNLIPTISPSQGRPSATPFFLMTPTPAFEVGPTPTIDPPVNGTGGDGESGLSKEEEASINESYALQLKTPVVLSQFDLRYETREDKFKVIVFDPYNENVSYFRDWLKSNGYESIKSEKFIIIRGTSK